MTQEDKDLLLKDLCARMPYQLKMDCGTVRPYHILQTICIDVEDGYVDILDDVGLTYELEDIKPYLSSISKLTEEEQFQLGRLMGSASYNMLKGDYSYLKELLEHVYKNHIDLFGLISMGLAIEAPKEMYKS